MIYPRKARTEAQGDKSAKLRQRRMASLRQACERSRSFWSLRRGSQRLGPTPGYLRFSPLAGNELYLIGIEAVKLHAKFEYKTADHGRSTLAARLRLRQIVTEAEP